MPPIPSLLIGRERDSVINLNNFRIGDSMSVALRTGLEQIGAQGVSTITHIPSGLLSPALAVARAHLGPSKSNSLCERSVCDTPAAGPR